MSILRQAVPDPFDRRVPARAHSPGQGKLARARVRYFLGFGLFLGQFLPGYFLAPNFFWTSLVTASSISFRTVGTARVFPQMPGMRP